MQRMGYEVMRRRGSHIRLERRVGDVVHVETIPDHKVLAKGTLRTILKHISKATGRPLDELMEMFR